MSWSFYVRFYWQLPLKLDTVYFEFLKAEKKVVSCILCSIHKTTFMDFVVYWKFLIIKDIVLIFIITTSLAINFNKL